MDEINVFDEFIETIRNEDLPEIVSGTPMMCQNNLAKAYVEWQNLDKIYCPQEGLMQGTIFPELVRPYKKWRDLRHG